MIRAGACKRLPCGDGAHGPRVYDWTWTPIRTAFADDRRGWVLARASSGGSNNGASVEFRFLMQLVEDDLVDR